MKTWYSTCHKRCELQLYLCHQFCACAFVFESDVLVCSTHYMSLCQAIARYRICNTRRWYKYTYIWKFQWEKKEKFKITNHEIEMKTVQKTLQFVCLCMWCLLSHLCKISCVIIFTKHLWMQAFQHIIAFSLFR